jgi:hypothetical protein
VLLHLLKQKIVFLKNCYKIMVNNKLMYFSFLEFGIQKIAVKNNLFKIYSVEIGSLVFKDLSKTVFFSF